MPAVTEFPRMTAADFLVQPETQDGRRYELIAGEVVVSEPNAAHQAVVCNLIVALKIWTREAPGLGTATINLDTAIDDHTILVPDLQWFASGRTLPDPFTRPIPLGDIVIEIRSPSTWHRDVGVKRGYYERHGAREMWLIDPLARTVDVLRRSDPSVAGFDAGASFTDDAALTSPLLPGFALALPELFRMD